MRPLHDSILAANLLVAPVLESSHSAAILKVLRAVALRALLTKMNHAMISTWVVALLMLAGCGQSSRIQDDYIAQRDNCQSLAEQQIVKYEVPGKSVTTQARNAELVTLFSDCMAKNGWQVATPKREDQGAVAPTAFTPPVPVTTTAAPVAPVSAPAPAAAPAPVPAPVVAPTMAPPPGAATYQPGLPSAPVAAPGRSF